jgi:hypothetical protein
MAVLGALNALATDSQTRALGLANLDVRQILIELALVDDRPDVGAGVPARRRP